MLSSHSYILEGQNAADRQAALEVLTESLVDDRAMAQYDVVHMSKSGKEAYTVDDAAELIGRLSMAAYGGVRLGIVDDADQLPEIVQNKLLKTLEEPAEGTVIVLVTANRDNLIPTVRSRCVVLKTSELIAFGDEDEVQLNTADYAQEEFCRYREAVDKGIKTQTQALELLRLMEEDCRDRMINGRNPMEEARSIELIEKAREDICKGMKYSKALRRLYLELN